MKKFLSIFCCCLIQLYHTTQAQDIKHIDIKDGLSHNSVTSLMQDSKGYLWIGTYDGLNKYDGYNFRVYKNRIGDEHSLRTNTVHSLAETSSGDIWVGGVKGVSVLKKNEYRFTNLYYQSERDTLNTQELNSNIQDIQRLSNGDMLVASYHLGLLLYKRDKYIGKQIPLILPDGSSSIFSYDVECIGYNAHREQVWIAVKNYGIYSLDLKSNKLLPFLRVKSQIKDLLLDTQRNLLWMATEEGLFGIDTKNATIQLSYLNEISVTRLLIDHAGKLWITTDGSGIYTIENDSLTLQNEQKFHRKQISSSDAFFGIFEDRERNIWLGSLRAGISMISHRGPVFQKYLIEKGSDIDAQINFVSSFCEAKNGKGLYIGTSGEGIQFWDREADRFQAVNPENGYTSKLITGITQGIGAKYWVTSWNGGVDCWDSQSNRMQHYTCYNTVTGKEEKNAWFSLKDTKDQLWVSTSNTGTLYRFNPETNQFEIYNSNIRDVQCMIETKDGTLWAGNYSELLKINPTKHTFESYELGYPVRSLAEDSNGQLWVGLQEGGLLSYNRKNHTYKRFTTDEGLPDNTILRILEDEHQKLWLSTYHGIASFDKTTHFTNYSSSDGLQSNQFSFNAGLRLHNGDLAFGGINGFNVFNPIKINPSNETHGVQLKSVTIQNKELSPNGKELKIGKNNHYQLQIPYDQTAVAFNFVAIDYHHADKIQYAYILENWDMQWNYSHNDRNASYNRLEKGTYQFKVKVRNENGSWGNPVQLATLTILPPWYRTWWSYTLYGLVIIGIFVLYFRYTKQRERLRYDIKIAKLTAHKERELAEKQKAVFTYLTHEFRTPLTLIINPIKKLVHKVAPEFQPDILVAQRNSERLLKLIDQLLIFRKAESDAEQLVVSEFHLDQMLQEIYACFEYRAHDMDIHCQIDFQCTETLCYGDFEKMEIVFFNLFSNAFKFTPKHQSIQVTVTDTVEDFTIQVADTGCGIHPEDVPHIFEKFYSSRNQDGKKNGGYGIGLFTVKYFVEKHGGYITCESSLGRGTTFHIVIKKGYEHFENCKDVIFKLEKENKCSIPKPTEASFDSFTESSPKMALNPLTKQYKILIVEDDQDMRNYVGKLFSAEYIVESTSNGKEAITSIKKNEPDLVISDVVMDEIDGIALCNWMKKDPKWSHIPIILLTSTRSSETELQGLHSGADDYITKPFDNAILLARVESLLKSRSELRRYYLDSITLKENHSKVAPEYSEFFEKCIQVIEDHITDKEFNVKEFSKIMGMSHSALYKKIKAISGQTTTAFIRSVRLRKAAILLLTTDSTIGEAGSFVGIEDPKYFRKKFVELFGMPPSKYVKKYRDSFHKEYHRIRP
ncbi:Signal transduction histidine kinase [Pustulibacterium marinum]|uniref:histidine kinase n=1 Tax=Pustulibacterium marinum TaxID=1224947 RepID=A0A1I7GFA5_9FLAO|nr:hybrid sensor histidine kinase/response regulator transcription factor [Pustulibacterium marinum]SFU47125.1 Signal transduction histidine kinase [Pustulibacterium marinum]